MRRREMLKQCGLPKEYTQVSYIRATDSPSYVDTEFIPNQDTRVALTCMLHSTSRYAAVYGTEAPRYSLLNTRADYGDALGVTLPGLTLNQKYRIEQNKNVIQIEGQSYTAGEYKSFTCTKPLLLFQLNGYRHAVSQFKGSIYRCKIYDNNQLVRNLVPCLRKSDSMCGFYDLVTERFFPATGAFTYGNE